MGEQGPRFFKAHGLGNDYLAAEAAELPFPLSAERVRLLCHRNFGLGSDGVLLRVPTDQAPFGLQIWNPDGSQAEKSGNGLRIFAAFLLHRGQVAIGELFRVETPGGVVALRILAADGPELDIEAEMGIASFPDDGEEQLELGGERVSLTRVSLGNPHCVVRRDDLSPEPLRRLAPLLATHPAFPAGTNVQFTRPTGTDTVEVWVWERGAGETLASGSSACAVAAVAVRAGWVGGREVRIRMPGGTLAVRVRPDWSLHLRGPVAPVFSGRVAPELIRRLQALP